MMNRTAVCDQEEQGFVTCVSESRHLFDVDDQVTFSGVKGMTQLNGITPHPVTDVHGIAHCVAYILPCNHCTFAENVAIIPHVQNFAGEQFFIGAFCTSL